MKFFLTIFILIVLIAICTSADIECEPYPTGMRTARECCVLPPRTVSGFDGLCFRANKSRIELEECFLESYERVFESYGEKGKKKLKNSLNNNRDLKFQG